MRRPPAEAWIVTAAVLAVGCGSRVDPAEFADLGLTATTAPPAVAASPDPATDAASTPTQSALASPQPSEVAAAERPSTPESEEHRRGGPDSGTPNDDPQAMPIYITVEPSCVVIGAPIAATLETGPRAELSMVVAYADGRPHGEMGFARTDDDGVYVRRWVVAPDVPPGRAILLVQAVSEDGRRGDTEKAEFEVASPQTGCAR